MADKLMFASEEERVAAITALGDDPKNLPKLDEIQNAEIGTPEAKPDKPPEGQKQAEGGKTEEEKTEPKTFTITDNDLPLGYKTPGEAFKGTLEKEALIQRQGSLIRELTAKGDRTDAERKALERAEKAEKELEQLRGGQTKPATDAAIADVKTEIQKIEALQVELDKDVDEDPDVAFTAAYQKKSRELSKLQTKHFNTLTALYTQAQNEIALMKKAGEEASQVTAKTKEEEQKQVAVESIYKDMDSLADPTQGIPELKLSKPAKDVEKEYVEWRENVALVFYERPARNPAEKFAALEQLQLKNPDLLLKCQIAGVKTEPTQDVARYIQDCEFIDYQMGYRKDPVTGKFIRLMKYDAATNTQVPMVLPSLKAAIQQKRLEDGYYQKKEDGAFQAGARSITDAAGRRDKGAVELDTGTDQGEAGAGTEEWALNFLSTADPEQAMKEYRRGKQEKMNEFNRARRILGMEPITFE